MVKVILEENDILELIKAKYPGAEIDETPLKDIEVVVRVKELKITPPPPLPPKEDTSGIVLDENGNIDADKSGLTSKSPVKTIPGGRMGRERGRMRTF